MTRRRGFTLMEIVLAIALTSVVTYLLTTAIELYLFRVDSSRTRVESAQLARTILDRMAADLASTRLYANGDITESGGGSGSSSGSGGTQGGGSQSGGGSGGSGGGSGGGGSSGSGSGSNSGSGGSGGGGSSGSSDLPLTAADVQGIYGTIEQLRIDRAALPNWQRASRQVNPAETSTAADMPMSVRYYLVKGDFATAQAVAQRGILKEQIAGNVSGLYRESLPTAAAVEQPDALEGQKPSDLAKAELLAPEVVKIEFAYYDGEQLVEQWDSFEQSALPTGVEIRLTLAEPSFEPGADAEEQQRREEGRFRDNELVEYRRFVRLDAVNALPKAELLMPQPAEQDGGGGREGDGGGEGQSGAGQGNGGDDNGQSGGGQGGRNGGGGND